LNYSIISQRLFLQNLYLTKHFDAWFEEIIYENEQKISFFIEMELCEKKLDDVINEFEKDSHFKTNGTLTSIGYYIASQLFIEMLEGVNFLHTQNPSLIHRDLHPLNILLKKCDSKGFSVKIADFGLMTQHEFSDQTHSLDKGKPKYTAPEVINNQIYNTKADIYSLGIIFRNLFDLEINE
jgi:serine/threonine protein kinase